MKISPRIAASRFLFNTFWITTCLGTGFALGSKATLPFQKKSIHFGELTWISEEARKAKISASAVQLNGQNSESAEVNIPAFEPFQLQTQRTLTHRTQSKKARSGFRALELAIQGLRKAQLPRLAPLPMGPTVKDFIDYQQAAYWFSQDFVLALVPRQKSEIHPEIVLAARPASPGLNIQAVTIQKSSAEPIKRRRRAESKAKIVAVESPQPRALAPTLKKQTLQAMVPRQQEPGLSQQLKKALANTLVEQQLAATKRLKNEPIQATQATSDLEPRLQAENTRKSQSPSLPKSIPVESEPRKKQEPLTCSQLPHVGFYNGMNNQVCPQTISWISKSGSFQSQFEGWLLAGDRNEHPTLSYYPAPNSHKTLILDTNSLILLGVKRGVRVTRGMGAIVGRAPTGFVPAFLGHAEKPEFFDLAGEKYFAILNVEPGAGVLELKSESEETKNETLSSTVFVPVLEDTITYLDLAKPETYQIKIKVLPAGIAQKSNHLSTAPIEYSVGVSTTGALQGVTRPNGTLELKGVPLVPGYPVFVDVVSRSRMTFRQALKNPDTQGVFTLSPPTDGSIRTWFKQLAGPQKPSVAFEQGGILFSQWSTHLFDGFKNHYISKIKSLQQPWSSRAHTVLWNGQLSEEDPIEADLPRVFAAPIPEGLARVSLVEEGSLETNSTEELWSELIPVSPRVVHVITK